MQVKEVMKPMQIAKPTYVKKSTYTLESIKLTPLQLQPKCKARITHYLTSNYSSKVWQQMQRQVVCKSLDMLQSKLNNLTIISLQFDHTGRI